MMSKSISGLVFIVFVWSKHINATKDDTNRSTIYWYTFWVASKYTVYFSFSHFCCFWSASFFSLTSRCSFPLFVAVSISIRYHFMGCHARRYAVISIDHTFDVCYLKFIVRLSIELPIGIFVSILISSPIRKIYLRPLFVPEIHVTRVSHSLK